MFIASNSSLDEHLFVLVLFSDSEKALFSFIEEIYDYDEELFVPALEVSLEVLFDIHIEYITRKRYFIQTDWHSERENLIMMLNDLRWQEFVYPSYVEDEGVELYLSSYAFKLLDQILILGGYKNHTEALIVVIRLMYILSVQKARCVPVNGFRKIYNTEIKTYGGANFIYENLTKEIKGMVTFH